MKTNQHCCLTQFPVCTHAEVSKQLYFSRQERNPFYQSAEELVDGNTTSPDPSSNHKCKSPDEDGGYDTLKDLPLSRGTGKLIPLEKKEKGYFYCLSPTDPPIPLSAVTVPNPFYEKVSTKGLPQRPRGLLKGSCARRQPLSGRDSDSRPTRTRSCDEIASSPLQSKNSPIYEMVQQRSHKALPSAAAVSTTKQPPALPKRGKLQGNAGTTFVFPPPLSLQLSDQSSNSAESILSTCNAGETCSTTSLQKDITDGREENTQEDISAARDAMHPNTNPAGETGLNGPPTDVESLYAKVNKAAKKGAQGKVGKEDASDIPASEQQILLRRPDTTDNSEERKVKARSMFVGEGV